MARSAGFCDHGFWHTREDFFDRPLERSRYRSVIGGDEEWQNDSTATPSSNNSHLSTSNFKHASVGHLHSIDDDDHSDERLRSSATMGRPLRACQSVRFADGANTIHRFRADRATDQLNPTWSDFYANKKINGHRGSYSNLHRDSDALNQYPRQRRSIAGVYSVPINRYRRFDDSDRPPWWKVAWKGASGASSQHQPEPSPSNSNHSRSSSSSVLYHPPSYQSNFRDNRPPRPRQPVQLRRFYDQFPNYEKTELRMPSRRTNGNAVDTGAVKRFLAQVRYRLSAAMEGKKTFTVIDNREKPIIDGHYRQSQRNGWVKSAK